MSDLLDHLDVERYSALDAQPLVVLDAGAGAERYRATQAVVVGLDATGRLPAIDARDFDMLITTAPRPPAPWVGVAAHALTAKLDALAARVQHAPFAASVLRQVLRINESISFEHGLMVESFAYSSLLGGSEFRHWRQDQSASPSGAQGGVDYSREGDHVTLTLAQPRTRNAISAAMRDALFETLAAVLDDPSTPTVTLRGTGACFSVGGDLAEFGANADLSQAHAIRTLRSVARLIHELGPRIEVVFHGACIGSGLEGPAAAAKRTAIDGAFFQLPELKMGLIPGAGGTVSVPRAIGRHRACAMMLGANRVSAATALDWGLVHAVRSAP